MPDTMYSLNFDIDATPVALEPTLISYSAIRNNEVITNLKIVHEQLSHLIIVSENLRYFDHIHADFNPDTGIFSTTYKFPKEGRYILFADFTPFETEVTQVERYELEVQEKTSEKEKMHDKKETSEDILSVQQQILPENPTPKQEIQLMYRIEDKTGDPVGDIQPYLNAPGHLIIISEDTQTFLHAHPQISGEMHSRNKHNHDHHLSNTPQYYGPDLTFHTNFPSPGFYRIWLEFKRKSIKQQYTFGIKIES